MALTIDFCLPRALFTAVVRGGPFEVDAGQTITTDATTSSPTASSSSTCPPTAVTATASSTPGISVVAEQITEVTTNG